jgi:hypothetical protein
MPTVRVKLRNPHPYLLGLAKIRHPGTSTAHYANRVRGERPSEEVGRQKHEREQPRKRRCSPTWARRR